MPFRQISRLLNQFLQVSLKNLKTIRSNVELGDLKDRTFDLGRQQDIDYINDQKKIYEQGVAKSDTEGNETDRSLSSQLILITTVLLTANILVFGNDKLLESLTYAQTALLFAGIGSLMASLWCGIEYYQDVRKFHKTWGDTRQQILMLITNVEFKTFGELHGKIARMQGDLNAHIDEKNLRRQIWAIKFALVVYFVFALALLLDFRFLTSSIGWYS